MTTLSGWREKEKKNCFEENLNGNFNLFFRVVYIWYFNWRLHPPNERAIGATTIQMRYMDINFCILQQQQDQGLLFTATVRHKLCILRHGGHDKRAVAVWAAGRLDPAGTQRYASYFAI